MTPSRPSARMIATAASMNASASKVSGCSLASLPKVRTRAWSAATIAGSSASSHIVGQTRQMCGGAERFAMAFVIIRTMRRKVGGSSARRSCASSAATPRISATLGSAALAKLVFAPDQVGDSQGDDRQEHEPDRVGVHESLALVDDEEPKSHE